MLNKLFLDKNYNVMCLANIQEPYDRGASAISNTIKLEIDADDTPNQYLEVTYGENTATISVTSGTVNEINIPTTYWNYGSITYIEPYKNNVGIPEKTINITFPEVIDRMAALSGDDEQEGLLQIGQNYSMAGTEYANEDVKEVKEEVETHSQEIDNLQENKQNFIPQYIDYPPASGQDGDMCFVGLNGNNSKELWRYEDNQWVRVLPNISYGTADMQAGAALPSGSIYLQYEA